MKWLVVGVLFSSAVYGADSIPVQVKNIFTKSCYGCHGEPGHAPAAGLDILDYDKLISSGLIVPGSPEFSLPFEKISKGEMPPFGENFPNGQTPPDVSSTDLKVIEQWILDGAKNWDAEAPPITDTISYSDVLHLVAKDLQAISSSDAKWIRYLSLAHLKDAHTKKDDLDLYRKAIVKFMNSMSTSPALSPIPSIDKDQLVFRVDLRNFNWFPSTWDRFEVVYPFELNNEPSVQKDVTNKMFSREPFLRADWFVATGIRPPLYHDILFLDQMTIAGTNKATFNLENFLGVDRINNILNGQIKRAGFNNSGVSVNNRIIERHEIKNYSGAYWLSYDFNSNSINQQNIFNNPIGPVDAFPNDPNSYKHAGGEVIFNLPNGLQGYLLVNAKDVRLDKAPTNIVTDPSRPDHAVENGVSCFRCHNQGMILKDDTLREYIIDNKQAFAADFNVLMSLYGDKEEFLKSIRSDLNRYLNAVTNLGIDIRVQEPVSYQVQKFEKDLDVEETAVEFYLTKEALIKQIQTNQELKKSLGILLIGDGSIKRDFLLENYQSIAKSMGYHFKKYNKSKYGHKRNPGRIQ